MRNEKTLTDYRAELLAVKTKIQRLTPKDSHIDALSNSFHLGRVGGSGRNNCRLNKRREAYLGKTISAAKELSDLYKEQNYLEARIKDLEEGGPAKRAAKKAETNRLLAEYWKNLKAGDYIDIGNGKTLVSKKNAKSLETGPGCKWTAAEIIGREAAALL